MAAGGTILADAIANRFHKWTPWVGPLVLVVLIGWGSGSLNLKSTRRSTASVNAKRL